MNEEEKCTETLSALKDPICSTSSDSSPSTYTKSSGHETSNFGDIESIATTKSNFPVFEYSDISSSSSCSSSLDSDTSPLLGIQFESTGNSNVESKVTSDNNYQSEISTPSPVARRNDTMFNSSDTLSNETISSSQQRTCGGGSGDSGRRRRSTRIAAVKCIEKLSKNEHRFRERKFPVISIEPPKREFTIDQSDMSSASDVKEKHDSEINGEPESRIDKIVQGCDSRYGK